MLEYITANLESIAPVVLAINIILLLLALVMAWSYWKLYRGMRLYRQILERFGERDIEEELGGLLRQVEDFARRMDSAEKHGREQDQLLQNHSDHLKNVVQQVGLVRYNAFPDVAGDQSYSLALLNLHGDGVVLTTLHGRAEARTYAKKVLRGTSNYPLLPEEQQAIYQALQSGKPARAETRSGADTARETATDEASKERAYLLGRRTEMLAYSQENARIGTSVAGAEPSSGNTAAMREETEEFARVVSVVHPHPEAPLPELAALVNDGLEEQVTVVRSEETRTQPGSRSGVSRSGSSATEASWPDDRNAPPPWMARDSAGVRRVQPFTGSDAPQGFQTARQRGPLVGAIDVPPEEEPEMQVNPNNPKKVTE